MKKSMLILATVAMLIGCETKNTTEVKTTMIINGQEVYTYVIDSCEYIGYVSGMNYDILTHKGNCKFCTTRNKKK